MARPQELWIPLVDEPIGSIVDELQAADPEIARLADTPRRLLAFRTFAYIRAGMLLGRLLVEQDVQAEGGEWVEELLRQPATRDELARELRAVAEEIAADPAYAEEEPVGPDAGARERFREFARKRFAETS